MHTLCQFAIAVLVVAVASGGQAGSPSSQRYIEMMVQGGPPSIRNAAQSIVHTGETDREVLDVAAEVLLQGYNTPGNRQIDAMAWLCNAIGSSGDARYRDVLTEVIEKADSRKMKKYANKALGQLRKGKVDQYKQGGVNLARLKQNTGAAPAQQQTVPAESKTGAEPKQPIGVIKVGMSMREVYDLVGDPTATTSHVTGKTFAPFYYGGDTHRMIALYKGQGRIVFSRKAMASPVWRVIEVLIDPKETGYP